MPKKFTKGNLKNPEKFLGTILSDLIIVDNHQPGYNLLKRRNISKRLNNSSDVGLNLPDMSNRLNMSDVGLNLPDISKLMNKRELNMLRSQLMKNVENKHALALKEAQQAHLQQLTSLKKAKVLEELKKVISKENVVMKPVKRVKKNHVEKKRFKPYPGAPRKKK